MGRAPCCDKANVKRGPWSPEEDTALKSYVERHGSGGNWIALPQKAGLNRCGKSCRLRWLNYLRPDIKHGGFTEEEDNMICALYSNIGSRWSVIASQLPGRTDNDVKNYWNTKLKKKLLAGKISQAISNNNNITTTNNNIHLSSSTSPDSLSKAETYNYSFLSCVNTSSMTALPFSTDVGLGQNVDSRHHAPNPINYPLPGLMEAYEFGANADNSQGVSSSQEASGHSASSSFVLDNNYVSWWSGNGGGEDDGLLMDFGFGSSYDPLNGFSLQEKTSEAAPSLANSSYTNLFTNVSDTNY